MEGVNGEIVAVLVYVFYFGCRGRNWYLPFKEGFVANPTDNFITILGKDVFIELFFASPFHFKF